MDDHDYDHASIVFDKLCETIVDMIVYVDVNVAVAVEYVIVDLRPESPTYLQHIAVELTAHNHRALYVPKMFGHGMQTLADNTEVFYQISEFYAPGRTAGLRYNDPRLGSAPAGRGEISPALQCRGYN
jgi:dTDP-4-dehydrorhamnose 3,5-epimerase-like enzyme